MSAALHPRRMTLDEFLAWEEKQELRYEFDGVAPVAMTGGTFAHDAIQVNLLGELRERLRGKPCRAHGGNLKVNTGGKVRYPDAYASCAEYRRQDKFGRDPVVLFEVLSESSERTDLIYKNEEYEALSSVQRYVVVEQDRIGGVMFERVGDDWIGHLLRPGMVVRMPEADIELPLEALYEGIDLAA